MENQSIDHYILKKIFWGNKFYFLLLFIVGIVFYIFNVQTPFSHDDYAYCFYYDIDSYSIRPTNIRVTNVFQMFESMWHHYLCVNGRFVSHTILQCFSAFWGKGVFNICNTLVFILFLHTILLLSEHRHSVIVLLITFIISMSLLPFPGQTMLWMTGSINYLWTATFTLIYLYWIKQYKEVKTSISTHVFAFVICFLIGWTNESITAPVTLGLFFFFLFNKSHFCGYIISSFLGYALGAVMIVFGPGTIVRLTNSVEVSTQMDLIQFFFLHVYNTLWGYLHYILPLLVLFIYIILSFKWIRRFTNKMIHNLYVLLFLSFTLFLFALGLNGDRIFFGVSVLCILILYKYLSPFFVYIEKRKFTIILLLLICVLPVRSAFLATKAFSEYNDLVCAEIIKSPSKCVVKSLPCDLKSRYAYVTVLDTDIYSFHNRVKAFYYGKEFIQALPEVLYDAMKDGSLESRMKETDRKVDGVTLYEFDNFWLLPMSNVYDSPISAVYTLDDDFSSLSSRQKLIRYLLNTLNSREILIQCFPLRMANSECIVLPQMKDSKYIEIKYNN